MMDANDVYIVAHQGIAGVLLPPPFSLSFETEINFKLLTLWWQKRCIIPAVAAASTLRLATQTAIPHYEN